MSSTLTEIRIFIASPGDMTPERERLLRVIHEFNLPQSPTRKQGLFVQALDWRQHVVPAMGLPEEVILQQLPVDTWDIFIGMMWQRFGSATGSIDPQTGLTFDSGTVQEFTLAQRSWEKQRRPHILFFCCNRPMPRKGFDSKQYQLVEDFLAQFAPGGEHPAFIKEFEETDQFERDVRLTLQALVPEIGAKKRRGETIPSAEPIIHHHEHDEKIKRYLDWLIKTHKSLPVAGFETNLRIPIPLENVYVTLKARLAELERGRAEHAERLQDQNVTAQEALKFAIAREYDGLVILGNPGAGKTTLTKYFLLCFATDAAAQKLDLPQRLLPILIALRDVDPAQSFLANVLAALQKYMLGVDEESFLPYLRDGHAILLLDGLDEVPTEAQRSQVSQWIHHQAHLAFPHCPLLVTSRFSGYRGEAALPGHYLRLEIQDYDMEQVKQFLENWLTGVETHLNADTPHWRQQALLAAENLYRRIEAAPALRELAVNPLMLQIIALVNRDRGALPDRRVELYKECTDVLLERWDKAKGLEVLLSAAQARQLLQPIALWMHSEENRREVSKPELLAFMQPLLPQIQRAVAAEALLQSWQERSGIFKGEGDAYFFHHLSFQEYLTAEEIRNARRQDILVKNFDHAWWREPTLLAMGLTNPPIFSDFMAELLRAKWRDGARVDFMLRCIDETLRKDAAPFVDALKRLRRFDAKYSALLALERIATDEAKAALQNALDDADDQIAGHARSILARLGETAPEEKVEMLRVQIDGKARELPKRLFNAHELNAEYILIKDGKYKYSVTKKETVVPPLYFAKYPVTNKLYRRFIDYLAGKKNMREVLTILPPEKFAESLLKAVKSDSDFFSYLKRDNQKWSKTLRSEYDGDKRFNGDDQPVVGVSWFAATAYCQWLGNLQEASGKTLEEKMIYRLPNEEEWEWAAGGGKREYPWGDEKPDNTRANYGDKVGQTTPVGAYPAGATAEGLMDMAGNVWEWMENLYIKGSIWENARALRGGSWADNDMRALRCESRYNFDPDLRGVHVGIRVLCAPSIDRA